ncbi:MAG: hypothetical protein CL843_16375 [Crocinitomicaceae bacterium]|nr:hypothetical protein [Crocinitomicaceae bacterium]|tara:strand:+ start:3535 stop:3954 length:420 start_codon:yes stop_codon:yes gene_type:complete
MSAFLEKTDYSTVIKNYVLDAITEADDSIIDTAEGEAISLMSDYLNIRYDVAAIFSATGEDRHNSVVLSCKDITLFLIHQRHNPRKIPKYRTDAYERAIEWLENVRDGERDPFELPLKETTENNTVIEIKSNPKRVNHY